MRDDRNSAAELRRDVEFLAELQADLEAGRAGDSGRLDALAGKLEHWREELQEYVDAASETKVRD